MATGTSEPARITLTSGQVAVIDAVDFPIVEGHRWWPNKQRRTCYAMSTDGSACGSHVSMHRLLLGVPVGMVTDHRNGDGLDNRRSNIRIATSSQNNANRRKRTGCSSKYKGVSWDKDERKWFALITYKGHRTRLGHFRSEVEAAMAYNAAAMATFGEFALINVLDEMEV